MQHPWRFYDRGKGHHQGSLAKVKRKIKDTHILPVTFFFFFCILREGSLVPSGGGAAHGQQKESIGFSSRARQHQLAGDAQQMSKS